MTKSRNATLGLVIAGQMVLITAALLIGIAPQAEGTMLVIPIVPSAPGATMRWVAQAGGLLVVPARRGGALVVFGARASMVRAALRHGALIVRASGAGCTTISRDAE